MARSTIHVFVVHHTPKHASAWLNQVELFFSILSRKLLRRGEGFALRATKANWSPGVA